MSGTGSIPRDSPSLAITNLGQDSLNKGVPRHGALNCPVMACFLVVIRKAISQCTSEAAVPCRKVVAADTVGETPAQPPELLPDEQGKKPSWRGLGEGVAGQHTIWEPRGLIELPNLDTPLGLVPPSLK